MRIFPKNKACVLLLLVLVFSLSMTGAAYAYTEGFFEYSVEDQSITITGYFGSETEVTVPAQIAGYPVSKIASGAFADTTISLLHLPETIMEIEEGAIGANITVTYDNRPAAAGTAPAEGTADTSGQDPTPAQGSQTGNTAAASSSSGNSEISESSETDASVFETDDSLSEADVKAAEAKQAEDAKAAEAMEEQAAADTAETEAEAPAVKKSGTLLWAVPAAVLLLCGAAFLILRKKNKGSSNE